jgi:hypothetical protein
MKENLTKKIRQIRDPVSGKRIIPDPDPWSKIPLDPEPQHLAPYGSGSQHWSTNRELKKISNKNFHVSLLLS